jgi:tight adherence protein B
VLVSTLVVSSRSGGSLISALRNISTALEMRKETRREVKTILGQSLAVGWAIAGMGALLLVGIYVISPDTFAKMTHSLLGEAMLLAAVGLFIGALALIRRITRVDI